MIIGVSWQWATQKQFFCRAEQLQLYIQLGIVLAQKDASVHTTLLTCQRVKVMHRHLASTAVAHKTVHNLLHVYVS